MRKTPKVWLLTSENEELVTRIFTMVIEEDENRKRDKQYENGYQMMRCATAFTLFSSRKEKRNAHMAIMRLISHLATAVYEMTLTWELDSLKLQEGMQMADDRMFEATEREVTRIVDDIEQCMLQLIQLVHRTKITREQQV